jgi:hypothetical protein
MKKSIRLLGSSIGAALALFTISCTQSDLANSSDPAQSAIKNQASQNSTPTPIAKIDLKDDHAVEFYDFGEDVLISESGKAGTAHSLNAGNQPSALIKSGVAVHEVLSRVWSSVSPGTPVPQSLLDIQARWKAAPPQARPAQPLEFSHNASGLPFGQSLDRPQPLAKAAAPVGCNNGCCDFQWLSTLSQCSGNYDYDWFLYNYGYSYANSGDVDYYTGMVCSAVGTSTYKVSISSGAGGTWSVPQATYRTYWWSAGVWNKSMTSSVNSSGNQHLHTYCGGVNH